MSQQQGTIYFAWKKCGIGESNLALSARLSAKMFGFGGSRFGDQVRTGKTETKLKLLAIRRAQLIIDRELKTRNTLPRSDIDSEPS